MGSPQSCRPSAKGRGVRGGADDAPASSGQSAGQSESPQAQKRPTGSKRPDGNIAKGWRESWAARGLPSLSLPLPPPPPARNINRMIGRMLRREKEHEKHFGDGPFLLRDRNRMVCMARTGPTTGPITVAQVCPPHHWLDSRSQFRPAQPGRLPKVRGEPDVRERHRLFSIREQDEWNVT